MKKVTNELFYGGNTTIAQLGNFTGVTIRMVLRVLLYVPIVFFWGAALLIYSTPDINLLVIGAPLLETSILLAIFVSVIQVLITCK